MDKADADDVPLVDSHAHVWTADMPLPPNAWFKPPGDAAVEQFVATLEQHGVKHGVLSAVGFFDDYNDYTLDATCRYKHLRTTVIVPPTIDPYIMRMMRDDGTACATSRRSLRSKTGCRMPIHDASSAAIPH
jgi:predicted TIM-barrel fold metal-dependent hydrolase